MTLALDTATTTAWGRGMPLDTALDVIAQRTDTSVVELAIGARPVPRPVELLESHPDTTFLAHHSAPILPAAILRPTTHTPEQALSALRAAHITRYTIHPPSRRHVDEAAFYTWAWAWHDTLADAGIELRLETMYVPRTADESERTGGYHLDTAAATLRFAQAALQRGWEIPLLIDVSHLYIGVSGGGWTTTDVTELLSSGLSDHLHVSANDGRRDLHVPVPDGHPVMSWLATLGATSSFRYVVDEGRRDVSPASARG